MLTNGSPRSTNGPSSSNGPFSEGIIEGTSLVSVWVRTLPFATTPESSKPEPRWLLSQNDLLCDCPRLADVQQNKKDQAFPKLVGCRYVNACSTREATVQNLPPLHN